MQSAAAELELAGHRWGASGKSSPWILGPAPQETERPVGWPLSRCPGLQGEARVSGQRQLCAPCFGLRGAAPQAVEMEGRTWSKEEGPADQPSRSTVGEGRAGRASATPQRGARWSLCFTAGFTRPPGHVGRPAALPLGTAQAVICPCPSSLCSRPLCSTYKDQLVITSTPPYPRACHRAPLL